MLPAYTINRVIYCEVYEDNTDVHVVKGFLKLLLPFCSRYPEPRSVIFIDNASFYFFSPRTKEMLAEAGVLQEYQALYSPDLNPIKDLFGSVRTASERPPVGTKILYRATSSRTCKCRFALWDGTRR